MYALVLKVVLTFFLFNITFGSAMMKAHNQGPNDRMGPALKLAYCNGRVHDANSIYQAVSDGIMTLQYRIANKLGIDLLQYKPKPGEILPLKGPYYIHKLSNAEQWPQKFEIDLVIFTGDGKLAKVITHIVPHFKRHSLPKQQESVDCKLELETELENNEPTKNNGNFPSVSEINVEMTE